jgi:hypothetical protein
LSGANPSWASPLTAAAPAWNPPLGRGVQLLAATAATLTLAGSLSTVGTLPATATTPQCGPNCVKIFSAKFGTKAKPAAWAQRPLRAVGLDRAWAWLALLCLLAGAVRRRLRRKVRRAMYPASTTASPIST